MQTSYLDRLSELFNPAVPLFKELYRLLITPELNDLVTDQAGRVWLDTGLGLNEAEWWFKPSKTELAELAVALINLGGKTLDLANPIRDVMLRLDWLLAEGHSENVEPAGEEKGQQKQLSDSAWLRVHATLPELSGGYPILSIRKQRVSSPSLRELAKLQSGYFERVPISWLQNLVLNKNNLLITGGTGSGKTTLLTALIAESPVTDRVIVIEELPEILLERPNFVSLRTRTANQEQAGEIGLSELIIQSLRMRPDRLMLGEARGKELSELLAAFNTGHRGGVSTCHANRLEQVPARLETLAGFAGISPGQLAKLVSVGIDYVIHLERGELGRRIAGVGAPTIKNGELIIQQITQFS